MKPPRYSHRHAGLFGGMGLDLAPAVGQRRRAAHLPRWLPCVCVLAVAGSSLLAGPAAAASRHRVVQYHGYRITVPAGWSVYDLRSDPTVCVRFNRHAVYLGRPSSVQRCPAHAAGRTEAILIEPATASSAAAGAGGNGAVLPLVAAAGAQPAQGSAARLAVPAHGLDVTATWGTQPRLVARALGRRSLPVIAAGSTAAAARAIGRPRAAARRAAAAAAVFAGLGFDACSTPSPETMTAWAASPYRAIGVYIGGANSACAQANLTAAWVSAQSAAGWNLAPIYVGLQAPSNLCGCGGIVPGQASAEGAAAADDAILQAQALGIGTGSPLYFDMEGYAVGHLNTSAVLTFLAAWTAELHARGYQSGVYSSGSSGIADLVSRAGTTYLEPDDLWVADWNGVQSTSDPYVPSTDWPSHQRLHQYEGGHTETYAGVTLDIDSDFLDGATASVAPTPILVPTATVAPVVDGSLQIHAAWTGQTGIAGWQLLAGDSPSALAPFGAATPGSTRTVITVHSEFAYYAAQALGSAGQLLGTAAPVATPAHLAIFGHGAFVPPRGLTGLPVGCFTAGPCRLTTTISVGNAVLARTGPESVPAASGGLIYFKLTPAGRAALAAAAKHRLSVRVRVRDVSGARATTTLNLVPFATQGAGPRHNLADSPGLKLIGATDFVFRHAVGGILAGCFSGAPCQVSTIITVSGSTIARTGPEYLGAHELRYLIFTLTGHGRALLAAAKGNQLGVRVSISDGAGGAAGGHVVLVSYN